MPDMFWITIFTAKPFHTPFPPLPIQPFSDTMPSAWWDIHITCNYGTPLQSMGNCTHNPCCILLLTSFTYVHDSPAHMYMPQLFTHCLLTIICVMWMIVTYVINLPLLLWYTLFNWNIMRLIYSFFSPWSHFICYFLTCVYWCILLAF